MQMFTDGRVQMVKKRKIIVAIVIILLALTGLGYLTRYLFIPMHSYKAAEEKLRANQYDEAISEFTDITKRYDLSGKLARLGGFSDAQSRISMSRYEKGLYLREQESWEEAVQVFQELGDYKDSAEQVQNTELLQATSLIASQDYSGAIALLEALGDYDGGEYGTAQELLDQAVYERSLALQNIGKLSDAEAGFSQTEAYKDSYEQLQKVRYNMARNALLTYDFDTAKELFAKVGDYEDAKEILEVLNAAVDRVYRCSYTDITGQKTDSIAVYLWVHSVIVPGKLDEGVSVKMQESICIGEPTSAWFGAASYDYTLEQVRDADTWYFTYYGSDTADSSGALLLEAQFSEDYKTLKTRKVYKATRDEEELRDAQDAEEEAKVAAAEDDASDETLEQSEEGDEEQTQQTVSSKNEDSDEASDEDSEADDASGQSKTTKAKNRDDDLAVVSLDESRTWTTVTRQETIDAVKEGFRKRVRVLLAEKGNMAFYNDTDDKRLPHYCSVSNCLEKGTYVVSDESGRRYYCTEHEEQYKADPGYTEESSEETGSEENSAEENSSAETSAEGTEETGSAEAGTDGSTEDA